MARKRKLNKFEEGYLCAVSTMIGCDGCNTSSWETFKSLSIPLREVLSFKNLSEYDRDNLSKLKSFDHNYLEEQS